MQNPLAKELNRESCSSRRQLSGWQSRPVEVGEGGIETEVGVVDVEIGTMDTGEAIKQEQAELTALGLPAQFSR
jgi:hypothetical protein